MVISLLIGLATVDAVLRQTKKLNKKNKKNKKKLRI